MTLFAKPIYLNHMPSSAVLLRWVLPMVLLSLLPMVQFVSPVVMGVVVAGLVLKWILVRLNMIQFNQYHRLLAVVLGGLWAWWLMRKVGGLEAASGVLSFFVILKGFECQTRRDWQFFLLSVMFLLLVMLLFDQGLLMSLTVFVALMGLTFCLALLNDVVVQTAWRGSVLAFLLAMLPMVVLFVGMPRRETPLWGLPQMSKTQAKTGISDTMKPGSISHLVQSNEPMFSVTFDNQFMPSQQDLYWRVMVMPYHNGVEWRAAQDLVDNAVPSASRSVSYQLILEDDKGRIPALDYPLDDSKMQRRGILRGLGDVVMVYSRQGVRRIPLSSSLSSELPQRLEESVQKWYTRLPEHQNPRTHALAQQLWQQSDGNVNQFIQAAYAYFQKNGFVYTLQPPLLTSLDKTDEFLFNTKQGFCEHYADAFVVMMRAAGVPARVITGYQGGEYHEDGQFWQIRGKDAHAWAEVWLPEKQVWKRIDPTAAVANTRIAGNIEQALPVEAGGFGTRLWEKYLDQGRFYWQQWVVNYDNDRQYHFFQQLGFQKVTVWAVLLVVLGGGALAMLPMWWWWRRSRWQDISPLQQGFDLLKRRLLGQDFAYRDSLAANELRAELQRQDRLSEELTMLLDDYIRLRYAHAHQVPMTQARAWYRRACALAKKYEQKEI